MGMVRIKDGAKWVSGLRDSMAGLDAFLCCPGPSLKTAPLARLRTPGAMVAAVNTAYPAVYPDVWLGMDSPLCYAADLWRQPFIKVAASKYMNSRSAGQRISDAPQTHFIFGQNFRPWEMFARLGDKANFYWPDLYPNTFLTSLHVLFWLGVRNVYLIGCDFGGTSDYHDGRTITNRQRAWNRTLYREIVADLPMLRLGAEEAGRSIVSCTPDSPANEYLRTCTVDEALAEIAARQPAGESLSLHAAEANRCNWRDAERCMDAGVVTGCDAASEWQLPWWFANLRRHYAGPIMIADFGMTAAAVKCWQQHALIVRVPVPHNLKGWFGKPFAILNAPFRRIVWLDTDCQVRGDIGALFAEAGKGFSVVEDPWLPPFNTGVIAVENGNAIVCEWATRVFADGAGFRGDQELLASFIHARQDSVNVMPSRWNWLRLRGAGPGDAVIIHLTGPGGKRVIRDAMAGKPAFRGDVLLRLLPDDRPISGVEVGVLGGRLSFYLLKNRPQLHLTMVDAWQAWQPDKADGCAGDFSQAAMDTYKAAALSNTEFAADRRNVIQGDSRATAATFADASLDFAFIDADHTYQSVRADLQAWASKVRPGGIIAGHDIDHDDHPAWGVRQAVEEHIAAMPDKPELHVDGDYVWWFIQPASEPAEVA